MSNSGINFYYSGQSSKVKKLKRKIQAVKISNKTQEEYEQSIEDIFDNEYPTKQYQTKGEFF